MMGHWAALKYLGFQTRKLVPHTIPKQSGFPRVPQIKTNAHLRPRPTPQLTLRDQAVMGATRIDDRANTLPHQNELSTSTQH